MTVVQIEKPEDVKLADWFAELRSWFDINSCSPLLFAKARTVMDRDCFDINLKMTPKLACSSPALRSMARQLGALAGSRPGPRTAWL
jgi:hypothetical protein